MATRRRRRKSQAMRDDAQDDLYGNDGDRARGSGSESEIDADNDDDDGESTLTGPGEMDLLRDTRWPVQVTLRK